MKMLRMRERPVSSTHPLRRHDVRDLLGHAHGRLGCRCDQPSSRIENLFLSIDALETLAQRCAVEAPFANGLEPFDEAFERRRNELEPMGLDELTPAMPGELPPARRQLARAGVVDLEELGAERFGPEREDAMDTVASQTCTEEARLGQPAPRSVAGFGVACRGEPETAIAAKLIRNSVGRHRIEKRRRLALGGHERRTTTDC